jgi:HK97 family phage major capsid protein
VPYSNVISRTDASALIPEEVATDWIRKATEQSAVLSMFRRVPVGRAQVRFPVISALPVAYWKTGDTGLAQTTEVNWANKYLNIEECDLIIPVPKSVAEDVEFNLWDEVTPLAVEAVGRLVDATVFFGTNAPSSFPTNISAAAVSAGNEVDESHAANAGGFFADVDDTIGKIESDGFDATGFVAARSAKGKFRAARNANGDKLDANRVNGALTELDGLPVAYPMRGLFPSGGGANTNVRLFVGDWTNFVVGVRRDISMEVLDQAVIQDNTGAIVYNLAQQGMVALMMTMRLGWQVSNLINYDQPTEGSRFPVAVLKY